MGMADKVVLYSYLCFFRGFGEVGAAKPDVVRLSEGASAAFRRLCVETVNINAFGLKTTQPPSGGCVLKHYRRAKSFDSTGQPPSGGCVLKHAIGDALATLRVQPPSGGCVLKHYVNAVILREVISRLQAAVC